MALLESHLKQIELCSATISELPSVRPHNCATSMLILQTSFPPSSIFTNALLNLPDITALIRDPDSHENALFSVVPPGDLSTVHDSNDDTARRSTFFQVNENALGGNRSFQPPRRNTAVAAVLGGDMADRIRRERLGEGKGSRRRTGLQKDDIDIDLLLKGAEKLCKV